MRRVHILYALGIVGAIASLSTSSSAADTTVVQAPAPAVVAPGTEQAAHAGPNVTLITTGLVTFGLSYVPALVVATQSSQSADHNLYIPVAGPWLDIANRPGCGGPDCTTETTDKVLIGVDGVFQGVGAVMTVLGLLTPEHHETVATSARADKPTLHLTPMRLGPGGYGLGAFGSF